ncbi:hypothetical protein TNCV_1186671 [Trichonephila clavipes]|nr:hypothetical protein TNCV_1186671 [Trichonephila clavipes]
MIRGGQTFICCGPPSGVDVSAYGGKRISRSGIAVITFSLYSRRECVKRHRVLPIMVHVSSTYSRMDFEEPIL